jgi:hypothetical protein
MVRPREDGPDGTFEPADADTVCEDLRVRCVAAIERSRSEQGAAPNRPVIETTGQVIATSQTGEERALRLWRERGRTDDIPQPWERTT